MTARPSPWTIVDRVQAGEDARDLWRQSERYTYRIVTPDGAMTCPGPQVMTRAGTLLRRPALPLPARTPFVRAVPLSASAL